MSYWTRISTIAALFAVYASPAFAGRTDDLYIRYFKERRALTLDTTRIAVFDSENGSLADSDGVLVLRGVGLNVDAEQKSVIKGWSLVPVAAGRSVALEIDAGVSTVAASAKVDFVSPVFVGDDGGPLIVTPDVLVKFSNQVRRERVAQILDSLGAGTIVDERFGGMANTFRVRTGLRNGFDVLDLANRLAERDDVVFAEPNMIFTGRGSFIPNDPLFPDAWGLHNTGQSGGLVNVDMNAPQAWDVTVGDPSILVVIIDTGVEQDHPDINQVAGNDVTLDISTTGDPVNACDNHGTPVAGCVSGIINNGVGAVGIAPGCRVASVRTFISNPVCDGSWSTQTNSTILALAWAESIGARVTNNSNGYGFQSAAIAQKYDDTRVGGMIHFASAGNEATGSVSYPSTLSSVNSIGALNRFGQRASFSNWGFSIAFSAPGQDIITTDRTGSDGWVGGDFVFANGTSFASPYTAGVAALILSVDPTRSAADVEDIMRRTATNMGLPLFFGAGRPNAFDAVSFEPCPGVAPVVAEASPTAKNRFISFVPGIPSQGRTAIRVRLAELMNPVPPYPVCCPAPDFSARQGEVRWVVGLGECVDSVSQNTTFKCATLQCTPHYDNWERVLAGETLHVAGAAIVPSSTYEVSQISEGCDENNEQNFTPPLAVRTGRWGDVAFPYHDPSVLGASTEPTVFDIVGSVDVLKDSPGRVSMPLARLNGDDPAPATGVSVFDVTLAVDAVRLVSFPFSGPNPCN